MGQPIRVQEGMLSQLEAKIASKKSCSYHDSRSKLHQNSATIAGTSFMLQMHLSLLTFNEEELVYRQEAVYNTRMNRPIHLNLRHPSYREESNEAMQPM